MTQTFKLAVIPGDGIGKEVIESGMKVLTHMEKQSGGKFKFESDYFNWGSDYYLNHGNMIPENGVDSLKGYDAIYFGAVGDPRVPDHVSLWGAPYSHMSRFGPMGKY